jgi:type VI secretion system secreted protein Hcp
MAFDAFLKLDGIDGESTDAAHKGEIEVLSFSWGVNQTGSLSGGSGGGAGKASFQDLHFNTMVSKASPVLFKACATGQHIKKAVLALRKAGGRQQDFLKIELEDVLVSSYQPAGDAGGDAPVEDLALNFAKIQFSYTTQNADGSAGDSVTAGFDVAANKGT